MRIRKIAMLIFAINCGENVFAQSSSGIKPEWHLRAAFESVFDDNAFRFQSDIDGEIVEQQNTGSLQLNGDYNSTISSYSLEYLVLHEQFEKNSQPKNTSLFGESEFLLGNALTFWALEATHSIEQVLVSPGADLISENTSDQQIFTLKPVLKTREDKRNSFALSGRYSRVENESLTRSDAIESGTELKWVRRSTPVNHFGIAVRSSEIEFLDTHEFDYRDERIEAFFYGESRKTTYQVNVGTQVLTGLENGTDESSNTYSGSLTYLDAGSSVSVTYSDALTNTSFARAATDSNTGISIGGDAEIEDIISIKEFDATWRNEYVCSRCSLMLQARVQKVDYLVQSDSDYSTRTGSILLEYSLPKSRQISFGYSLVDVEFDQSVNAGRDSSNFNISYSLKLSRTISFSASLSRTIDESFSTNALGFSISGEIF